MREILFRGKKLDNGEWAYGIPVQCITNCYNKSMRIITEYNEDELDYYYPCISEENVIPETIGQYTGLFDKNNKKIFNGDFCKFSYCNGWHTGIIVFNQNTCGFEIWYDEVVGAYGEKATYKKNFSCIDCIEVIGNIHNNQELLECDKNE